LITLSYNEVVILNFKSQNLQFAEHKEKRLTYCRMSLA